MGASPVLSDYPSARSNEMQHIVQQRWRIFLVTLVTVLLGVAVVRAAIVDLDALVEYAILNNSNTPLADGSWVYIVGSSNNVIDPMDVYGGTNLIAASTTGDDVILGAVQINLDNYSNGTFFTTVQYDSDQVKYVYIRFFDFTNQPITGMVYWGTSTIFQLGVTLGVSTVAFDQGGQLKATNYNNFVVIPEPNTANLIMLVAGMIWAMRATMRRQGEPGEKGRGKA